MRETLATYDNFISDIESKYWIGAIDKYMDNSSLAKRTHEVLKRDIVPFGIDSKEISNDTLSSLGVDENYAVSLSNRVMDKIISTFNEDSDLYLTSFWFSRQHPGSFIEEHEDTDDGWNKQNDYSAIVYLNTLTDSGSITFKDLDYTQYPKAGDLIIFKSQDTGLHEVDTNNELRYTIPMWFTTNKDYSLT